MQRTYSLKKNAQFKYVYRRGSSAGAREMVLLYVRGPALKVGFSVGKKLGCAVQRNRIRRRLRAACVPLLPNMKPGLYVFIARQPSAEAEFEKLGRSMQYLLRKQNLLLPDGQNRRQPAAKAAAQP
ncbi:MAG: ribonuclease P protein component [Christensenellales bacterium]